MTNQDLANRMERCKETEEFFEAVIDVYKLNSESEMPIEVKVRIEQLEKNVERERCNFDKLVKEMDGQG